MIVSADSVPLGPGPHPAASPYDRRISAALGITAFEVYQVELPPHAATVAHNHVADRNEDVYAILEGTGWLVVDQEQVPVRPGEFIAVEMTARRHLLAGPDGMTLIALCAEARSESPEDPGAKA